MPLTPELKKLLNSSKLIEFLKSKAGSQSSAALVNNRLGDEVDELLEPQDLDAELVPLVLNSVNNTVAINRDVVGSSALSIDQTGNTNLSGSIPSELIASFTRGGNAALALIGNPVNICSLYLGHQNDVDIAAINVDHSTGKMSFRTNNVSNRLIIDSLGNVTHTNFTKLGSAAPSIKMKKLTGTTGATEGSSVTVAHGLTLSKIIGFNILVTADNGNLIPDTFVSVSEFQFDAFLDPTNVIVIMSVANSGNLLSNSFTVLLTYEE